MAIAATAIQGLQVNRALTALQAQQAHRALPAALLAPARLVHAYMVTAPARPSQLAALALMEASPSVLAEAREHLRLRWEAFAGAFDIGFGRAPAPSAGGFYHWQPVPEGVDPMAFCLRLRDEGKVIVVPGLAFGERGRGFIRLSYAGAPDRIREGVARLAPFWRLP